MIMGSVGLLSALISDSGTVAIMAPAVISISRKKDISPSKLLIPLSFGSLLGGAMTLIGTPPNILVSDLLSESGYTSFGFFDFTPIGFALLFTGTIYIILTNRWLLPDHSSSVEFQKIESPEELVKMYKLPDDLFRLRVRIGSPLIGSTIAESKLRENYNLTIIGIYRQDIPKTYSRSNERSQQNQPTTKLQASPDTVIQVDDILICQGKINDVTHASAALQLGVQPAKTTDQETLVNDEVGVAEILLPPRSRLIGKSLTDLRFGSQYQLTVLGINRPGREDQLSLKDTKLQFGDTLFVQGPWKNINSLVTQRRDFVVVGQTERIKGTPSKSKMFLAGLILIGMLILLVTKLLPLVTTALLAAFLMVISGCLDMKSAYNSVDWKSIILIAGMLPLATALEKVGLVEIGSELMANLLVDLGIFPMLAILFLTTSVFTQFISNTATTVLLAPVAMSLAIRLGYQPQASVMAVALAASTAFASPVASPVNTLVMAAGNYRFRDYLKVGIPLILVSLVVTVVLLPMLWPQK
jgi:di/tricarboxylate transporter